MNTTTNKNEIATTAQNAPLAALTAADLFIKDLQAAVNLSELAYGTQFTTEDLVNADSVVLRNFDIVEYDKDNGEHVRFAIWRCECIDAHGDAHEGYHQSGAVLTKIADKVRDCNYINELNVYGIRIKAHWGKTSSKNNILLVDIIGTATN